MQLNDFWLLFYFMTTKEEFIAEHNKLSPNKFKANLEILNKFELEKPSLVKNNDWSIEKVRRQFVFWLSSQSA